MRTRPLGQNQMSSRKERRTYFARKLIRAALGEVGLKNVGHYPLFLAVHHVFIRSPDLPAGRPAVHALAEEALWRAISEWLAGRTFPTCSARDTVAAAKRDGFDLAQRALEFLPLRRFLR
jgi:hypothetical protein